MMQIRHANERGMADFGWLQSAHSFSFGSYYDPQQMGHGNLRVINDDFVAPGAGFATHPHQNMEILSYILSGTIAHKDSTGNQYQVSAGEFQLMSAGRGITHSEFNASDIEPLTFLQIWIKPNQTDTEPGYQQKAFALNKKEQLILSPDGAENSLTVLQQAWLRRVTLLTGEWFETALTRTNKAYLHVVNGAVKSGENIEVKSGDGLKIQDEKALQLVATETTEFLLFEI